MSSSSSEDDPLAVTLDRLSQAFASKPQENMDTIKTLISRIHSKLKVQDSEVRLATLTKIVPPERQTLEQLIHIMEICGEPSMVTAVCSLLHDALSPNNKGDVRDIVIRTCLALNTAEVILRTLKSLSAEGLTVIEPCIYPAYQVVAKLASKDPKLAVKARLVGGVKLTHQLLQAHMKNNVPLLPLLMVTKYLAKNSTNQVMLGKDGCVATLASILSSVPKTHWAKIKFIMEILAHLTKAKSNVIRLVKETGLQRILSILDGWEKIERRHQLKILKAILATLSHMSDSKHGRKAITALNGVEITQRFIQSSPADKKFDNSVANATNVFLKCINKGELPVSSTRGAFRFQLPNKEDSDPNAGLSQEAKPGLDADSSDDEIYDDDHEEEEEEDFDQSRELKAADLVSESSVERPRMEELMKLAPLFPELSNYNVLSGTRYLDAVTEAKRGSSGESSPDTGNNNYYIRASDSTRSIINFVKVAYPEMIGAKGPTHKEQLINKDRKVCREKAIATVERVLHPESYMERVVYDLDYLLESEHSRQLITPTSTSTRPLSNWDEKRVGKRDVTVNHLNFESRFESGNLRRVIQASNTEYDCILNADVNSSHHHQWFYFEVSNMEPNTQYVFNIINNEKPNSEFNFGMRPVMFSVKEAMLGRPAWVRTGTDICYHKNHYSRIPKAHDNVRFKKAANRSYYTATFTISFPHAYDVCYLAYHYPYTYTQLQAFLLKLETRTLPSDTFYCSQVLCHTLNKNPVPLLTITSKDTNKTKEVVFLTARVHPGESNASWVMEGAIDFILGGSVAAQLLLDKFVFKIVPMLNIEGVIHGNHRCGLTDEDLNRKWRAPDPQLHPTIYHPKSLLEYLVRVAKQKVRIFCDFHGHSREKNVFMYGCSRLQSWWPGDRDAPDNPDLMLFPRLAQNCMNTFSLVRCHFQVDRARESTARVAVWRQFNIPMSYTMESTMCGCSEGPYKNYHISPKELLESGEGFCLTLSYLVSTPEVRNSKLMQERANPNSGTTSEGNEVVFWSEELDDELDSDDDLDLDLYGPM